MPTRRGVAERHPCWVTCEVNGRPAAGLAPEDTTYGRFTAVRTRGVAVLGHAKSVMQRPGG
jgi:hypothetical protein